MIRVAVTGATGRMGKTLVQAIQESSDLTLAAAFEHPSSAALGADVGELAGVGKLGINIAAMPTADSTTQLTQLEAFDVVIDFTVPEATLMLAQVCGAQGKAMVVGTTGFSQAQLSALQQHAQHMALFMAPNMSVGVNVMFKLVADAAKALGDSVDVEVMEMHHRHKVDAPSGTAVRLGEILADTLGRNLDTDAVYGRQGITGARDRKTIGFSALRGGDIVGEHTVMFAAEGERIEITHRAQSRMNFAQGALRAVRYVNAQPAGLYDMQMLLGVN